MELKRLIAMLRRWAWLIALLTILGTAGGYVVSQILTPIYQAETRVYVNRVRQEQIAGLTYQSDTQLVQTYIEMLNANLIQDAAARRLNMPIDSKAVQAAQIVDAQIISVAVTDSDPEKAAAIANTLIDELILQNETLHATRYETMEQSLQSQVAEVEAQITDLQNQSAQASQEDAANQLAQVNSQLDALSAEINQLSQEIAAAPAVPTVEERAVLAQKQARLAQIQPMLTLYQQLSTNLAVLGKPSQTGGVSVSARQAQIDASISLYQQIYLTLLNNLETVRLARSQGIPNIVQIEKASPPDTPIYPVPVMFTAVGAVIGLMLSIAGLMFMEYMDTALKTPAEIELVLNVPVLGSIASVRRSAQNPRPDPLITKQPYSATAEAYLCLCTNLESAARKAPFRTLLVTSVSSGEGKTSVSVNLAAFFTERGKHVTLVDANLHRSRVHVVLGMENAGGVSEVLKGLLEPQAALRHPDSVPGLAVLTGGSPEMAGLFDAEHMIDLLEPLKAGSDLIIIDSPPLFMADARVLAASVDAILVVLRPGVTHIDAANAAMEQIRRIGTRVVGAVLNNVSANQIAAGGYYLSQAYHGGNGTATNGGVRLTLPGLDALKTVFQPARTNTPATAEPEAPAPQSDVAEDGSAPKPQVPVAMPTHPTDPPPAVHQPPVLGLVMTPPLEEDALPQEPVARPGSTFDVQLAKGEKDGKLSRHRKGRFPPGSPN